jgi:hypothetical protein
MLLFGAAGAPTGFKRRLHVTRNMLGAVITGKALLGGKNIFDKLEAPQADPPMAAGTWCLNGAPTGTTTVKLDNQNCEFLLPARHQ